MSRFRVLAREYWFEAGIVLLAIVGLLDIAVRHDEPSAPHSSVWFFVPAVVALVVAILARRRFPFAAPAAYWLLAAAIAFVDWRLIPFMTSFFVVGMAAAFLLGNLRNARQAAIGLAFVLGGSTIVVYRIPGHAAADLVFIPLEFAISWLAGFALRERAEKAEAAEERAAMAERERDAAARVRGGGGAGADRANSTISSLTPSA